MNASERMSMPYWESFLLVNLRNQIETDAEISASKRKCILELLKRIEEIYVSGNYA